MSNEGPRWLDALSGPRWGSLLRLAFHRAWVLVYLAAAVVVLIAGEGTAAVVLIGAAAVVPLGRWFLLPSR
jgi:hypothetical protein